MCLWGVCLTLMASNELHEALPLRALFLGVLAAMNELELTALNVGGEGSVSCSGFAPGPEKSVGFHTSFCPGLGEKEVGVF